MRKYPEHQDEWINGDKDEAPAEYQVEKAMEYAKASLAMEGMIVTDEESELVRKVLNGEISTEEFINLSTQ